jgi:hypothetical protein
MTTKILVPRASGEGGMGVVDNAWGEAYYDTGNFNKGLFVSGHNITQVIAETVTQGGLGGEWERNGLNIYYNGGNVGIGTTDPGAKLDIFGSNSSLKFTRDAGDRSAEMVYDGSKFLIKTPAGDRLSITDASSNELLTVNPNNGNVGIGTTSPDDELHIEGANAPYIKVEASDDTDSGISLAKQNVNKWFILNDADKSDNFAIRGIGGHTDQFLTIKQNGNVGIGTTSPKLNPNPGKFLTVFGASTGSGWVEVGTSSQTDNLGGAFTFNNTNIAGTDKRVAQISSLRRGADNVADLSFSVNNGNGTAPAMHIKSDGKVGIGTMNPGSSLHIQGTGGLVSTKIENTSSSDASINLENTLANYAISTQGQSLNIIDSTASAAVRMTVNSAGKVGIGTPNPIGSLHIFDNTVEDDELSALILSNYDYGPGETGQSVSIEGRVRNDSGGDSPVSKIVFGKDSDFSAVNKRDGNIQFHSMFGNNGTARFAERMRITSLGNVGIGTTSPSAKLDILGSFKLNNPGGGTLYPSSIDVYKNGTTSSLKHSAIFNTGGWRNATVIESVTGTTPSNFSTEGLYLNSTYGSKPFTSASIQVNCSAGNGDISFLTGDGSAAPTSKIKLQNNGNVGIGTKNPGAKLHIEASDNAAYSDVDRLQINEATLFVYNTSEVNNSYSQLVLGNRQSSGSMSRIVSVLLASGTSELSFSTTKNTDQKECMAISNDGVRVNDLTANADVTTNAAKYLSTSSDKRLKNDLGDCEYGLNEVLQVQPKRYTWKDGPKDANPTVGFFAQDVHDVMPEAAPREAIQNEKGEDDYKWGFHSQTIIAALVNATKEQQQLIEDLRSEVEALKNK